MQPSKSVSISSTSRSTKTRSPTAGAFRPRTNHSTCRNKPSS